MKRIDTAIFAFEDLIRRGCLYVDKTAFIWKLVNGSKLYFLSRPRRFGKSLLLSTFEAFFKGKKELFKGTAIERLAPEKWDVYPIIKLDMANAAALTVAEVEADLKRILADIFLDTGIFPVADSAKNQLQALISALYRKTGKQVVILVDEYDKPILDAIGTAAIDDILNHIRSFYQVIKSANERERFVFITGVTKFAHTSIFSGMNNPTDITMSADYAALLGYTQEELESNFSDYIDATAAKLGLPREKLLAEMKEWYDGFRFHADAPTVYNPVSVGKFFASGEFLNYWYDTGTPRFLVEVAKKKPFNIGEFLNTPIGLNLFDKYDVDELSPFVFAVQTGYVTIRDSVKEGVETKYIMDFPNREIRDSFEKFLLRVYVKLDEQDTFLFTRELSEALESGDADRFLTDIQPVFAGLPAENVLGGVLRERFYEGYFRNVLATILYVLNKDTEVEARTSDGRADLVVKAKDWTFVFELKMKRPGDDTAKLLDAALDQAINQKHYAEKYRALSKHIKIVAVVFDAATRRLAAWKAA